jgi:poly(A) polymerase
MRTSEELYHRVRWDPRFDPARFTLGVLVRGAPPKRVALPTFVPGGDIPWHRVLFVEADGEVVWDRAAGVDRIDESSAGRVREPRRLRAPFFSARLPVVRSAVEPGATLRVLTWNTLWDRYDSDLIDTARRRPLLIEALERADADVIALQEVEPPLLAMVTAMSGYTVCGGEDVEDCGLVLLSRLPVLEAGHHALNPHKGVSAVVVRGADGPVAVLNTHLTSDHHPEGERRRVAEVARLAEGLSDIDCPVVLLGDFNGAAIDGLGLADTWQVVHGDETPTFDPRANPLAKVSSLTGRAGRLDRVLVRGTRPVTAELLGTVAPFVSDHYGVAVELTSVPDTRQDTAGVLDVATTVRTAVAWVPPSWPEVDAVRAAHDPAATRWPPHVNLLYGFVPESSFADAAPMLSAAARSVAPFQVRFDEVSTFDHGTVYLRPADAAPWLALRESLVSRFPQAAGRFTPHLTVGRSRAAAAGLAPRSAAVGSLVVLSRRGDEPMRPRVTVELGTGAVRWLPSPGPSVAAAEPVEVPELDGLVHVVGSRRMGCARAGADLDLVAVVPDPGQVTVPGASQVVGARVPGLRFERSGVRVDLTLVRSDTVPLDQAVARRAELAAAAAMALSAVTDADAVVAAVGDRYAEFVWLARHVKAWAAARGLDSAPFGGLPGIAWTMLAARTMRSGADDLLAEFFGGWAAWDWREPVTLLGGPATASGAMTIMTPTEPVRSCTTQVGAGMRDLVTAELYASWEAGGDPLSAVAPHVRHAAWAVITVPDTEVGRTRGRMRGLLTELEAAGVEDAHAWPRPFDLTPVRFAIGLGRTPPTATELAALAGPWCPPGVTVEWVDGGGVPTLPY